MRSRALALVLAAMCAPGLAAATGLAAQGDGSGAPHPTAVPQAISPRATFPLFDPFDYTDVILLGNNNSEVSRNLTLHFQAVHSMPDSHVFFADLPDAESITQAEWDPFATWFKGEMSNRSLGLDINYIVTFKGVPIRVYWFNGNHTSFQDSLMLLGGTSENQISHIGFGYGYGNPYYNHSERFTFAQFGIRLVTGIYAYNESTAMALIDRAANSLGARGTFVLDTDTTKGYANNSGSGGWGSYQYANSALVWASALLAARGIPNFLDVNDTYVTGQSNVMGYSSWGSNDCCAGADHSKPKNSWNNGSIAETFVSTGGRTFTWPPSYGQSLIADWIDEGVTGMKGYVDEPYINAIADGHILYDRYTAGYNLAESFWSASHLVGWQQIVIGDPKMAPFADGTDIALNATLTSVPASAAQSSILNFTVGLDHLGPGAQDITLRASLEGGPSFDFVVAAAAFQVSVYDLSIDLAALGPTAWGTMNLTINADPDGAVAEVDEGNNGWAATLEVQRRPIAAALFSPQSLFTFESSTVSLYTTRADRPIVRYELSVDGGPPADVPSVSGAGAFSVSYPRSGVHVFFVWAVEAGGLVSDPVGPYLLTVINRPPSVNLTANDSAPLSMVPVSFSAAASFDMDGNITAMSWTAGPLGSGAGTNFTLTFPRPGNFTVSAVATDDEGATSSAFITIAVRNRAPTAIASVNRTQALTAEPFGFEAAASSDSDGSVASYTFAFDDGTNSTQLGAALAHAYASPGPTGAWITVTDDLGAQGTARIDVFVVDRPPVIALSVGPEVNVTEGGALALAAAVSDPDSALLSLSVEFGDGARTDRALVGRADNLTFAHGYPIEGRFNVTVRVYDVQGNVTVALLHVTVTHPAPVIDAHAFTAANGTLHVSYTITTPYESDLRLVLTVDGAAWKSVSVGSSGARDFDMSQLAPGNHSVVVSVTDGVKSTEMGRTVVVIEEAPAPSPTPGGNGANNGTAAATPWALFGIVAAAGAAAVVALFLVLRRRRAPAASEAKPTGEESAASNDEEGP